MAKRKKKQPCSKSEDDSKACDIRKKASSSSATHGKTQHPRKELVKGPLASSYVCNLCNAEFGYKGNLIRHQKRKTCLKATLSKGDCKQKYIDDKRTVKAKNAIDNKDGRSNEAKLAKENLECKTKKTLTAQFPSASSTSSKVSRSFPQNKITHRHGGATLRCKSCSLAFENRDKLKDHYVTYHKRTLFQCSSCPAWFTKSYKLSHHSLEVHKQDPYTCTFCKKSYKTRILLTIHQRNVHFKYQFKCNVCSLSFLNVRNLNKHHIRMRHGKSTVDQENSGAVNAFGKKKSTVSSLVVYSASSSTALNKTNSTAEDNAPIRKSGRIRIPKQIFSPSSSPTRQCSRSPSSNPGPAPETLLSILAKFTSSLSPVKQKETIQTVSCLDRVATSSSPRPITDANFKMFSNSSARDSFMKQFPVSGMLSQPPPPPPDIAMKFQKYFEEKENQRNTKPNANSEFFLHMGRYVPD